MWLPMFPAISCALLTLKYSFSLLSFYYIVIHCRDKEKTVEPQLGVMPFYLINSVAL